MNQPDTAARHLDYTPALNPYRKNPYDHTVWGTIEETAVWPSQFEAQSGCKPVGTIFFEE